MEPRQSEGVQRTVLATAIRGDLLARFPGALAPELFGQAKSPRSRLATLVLEYHDKYAARPVLEVLGDRVQTTAQRLSPAERQALVEEWNWILNAPLPDDPAPLYDKVREWIEYRRMETALLEASELLQRGPDGMQAARDKLGEAIAPLTGISDRQTLWQYQGEALTRLRLWRAGEPQGEKISTGLGELDSVLSGGPTRREVFYFLAPPKGAKTAALLRVALGAARRQFGVYMVTYEMQALRMMLRMDRMMSRNSKEELREDISNLERALLGLQGAGGGEIWVEEKAPQQPLSVEAAAARVQQIRRQGGVVDVVVLDYLNIMGSSRNEREKRHELTRISRDMASLARQENVLVWSAALVRRESVNKQVIRKTDIAEAFEVIAVADGMIAICASPAMIENRLRGFYVTAAREEEDEKLAGYYRVDFARMTLDPADRREAVAILEAERAAMNKRVRKRE